MDVLQREILSLMFLEIEELDKETIILELEMYGLGIEILFLGSIMELMEMIILLMVYKTILLETLTE